MAGQPKVTNSPSLGEKHNMSDMIHVCHFQHTEIKAPKFCHYLSLVSLKHQEYKVRVTY